MKYPGAVLVSLGLIGGLAGCKKTPDSPATTIVTGSGTSSQVLRNFQLQDILDGTKNMVVESVEGRLLDKEQAADVDKPTVKFFKQGVVSSTLNAAQGRVGMVNHEVFAWGGVKVVTPDSATLTTERLRYDPQKQLLLSDDPVRLEKPDSVTIGTGLEAETDLSRVRIGRQKVYVKARPK